MKKIFLFILSIYSIDAFSLNRFTILSYNVENLFDAVKDKGKNDWTFLPSKFKGKKEECNKIGYWRYKEECHKTDWTPKSLDLKLNQIKKYVSSLKEKPLFIGLSEVENEHVVALLAKKLGYDSYQVTNSPDRRGIDVALLYNTHKDMVFIKKNEHAIESSYFVKKPTRNILEVQFKLNKKEKLTIFVNHWPSLGNPTKTRIAAANTLKKRMSVLNKRGHFLIAVGDFNTIPENNPRPFEDVLLKNTGFYDVHELFMKDKDVSKKIKYSYPLGTYFYAPQMSWNLLDRIFINKRLKDGKGLDLIKNSYRIHAPDFAIKDYKYEKGHMKGSVVKGIPFSYNHDEKKESKLGFSDHFGILASFNYL